MRLTFCVTSSIIITSNIGGVFMPKMGRPKSENPKGIRFSIRLDTVTNEKLCEYAKENQITVGEAVRRAIKRMLRLK